MASELARCGGRSIAVLLLGCACAAAQAGGGLVLRDDICVLQVGFYEAHFTAYQPRHSGNKEFCQTLPDAGETLFALDYMHDSLQEVAVDFRIIKNTTGLGEFTKVEDVQALGDLDELTVFYVPPRIERDASFTTSYSFTVPGEYISVISAGHPTKNVRYVAAFPIQVAKPVFGAPTLIITLALGLSVLLFGALYARRLSASESGD